MASTLRIARESYRIKGVSTDDVLRYLGYHGQSFDGQLARRIDAAVVRCLTLAKPRGTLAAFYVHRHDEKAIELEGCTLCLIGHDICAHLDTASEVVLFAVTLGADIDRELRRLSLTDPLGQVVFDAASTALVERAADAANAHVRAYAAQKGAFTSWRFSPGYGDLPLFTQRDLLAALDATRQLGITLTPSDLMVPTKSVTAIVGVHPTPQPGLESSCSICSLYDFCTIRQTGRTCRG
ncbi:MAG: hypothetical protein IKG11_01540 [Atopobiaceae bacterium]|nr:hypothetical protein [Atopobiaceae bacterium]